MAASSGDGMPAQLAVLLGHPVKRIRITDETPPRISVIDVATAITGKHVRNAARDVLFVQEKHPEVSQTLNHFRFPGQGQRSTPVTCATGLIGAWQMQRKSKHGKRYFFLFAGLDHRAEGAPSYTRKLMRFSKSNVLLGQGVQLSSIPKLDFRPKESHV